MIHSSKIFREFSFNEQNLFKEKQEKSMELEYFMRFEKENCVMNKKSAFPITIMCPNFLIALGYSSSMLCKYLIQNDEIPKIRCEFQLIDRSTMNFDHISKKMAESQVK